MVDLTYNVKLMEYLRSQVALEIPVDDDKDMPGKIEEFNLKLIILHELGIIDMIKKQIPDIHPAQPGQIHYSDPERGPFRLESCNE